MAKDVVILRRLLIIIGVVFSCVVFSACADTDNAATELAELTDIYADNVYVTYDGNPHCITVHNILDSDDVTYSVDNFYFSIYSPSFTQPGEYTVYYKVVRAGFAEFTSFAKITIISPTVDGISAPNISVVYDGLPHTVTINGISPSDTVTYSSDGEIFSTENISFTEVGVYTVYYCVERGFGAERSSCTLTILPDISGRYFNRAFGLVVIDKTDAYINSAKKEFALNIDGCGRIDGTEFFVSDGVLTYGTMTFTALTDDDIVYKLSPSSLLILFSPPKDVTHPVFFCSDETGALTVSFDSNGGIVSLGDEVLLAVPNVNYCESGEIVDYDKLTFRQVFSNSDGTDITDIVVTLSRREVNPFTPETLYAIHDGAPHTFDFSVPFAILDGGDCMYTDVGSYTVSVLFPSNKYLPFVAKCTLVILPELNGLYYSPEKVIKVSGYDVCVDGEYAGRLTADDGIIAFGGLPITATDNGIEYDGVMYVPVSNVLIFRTNGTICGRAPIPTSAKEITAVFDGENAVFSVRGEIILSVSFDAKPSALSVGGRTLSPNSTDGNIVYIIGGFDFNGDTLIVDTESE